MTRTKLSDRKLPDYTRGEELFNMISHITGGAFGIAALVLCVVVSALHGDAYAVVGSAIYGGSMVLLYTVSSVYHGLNANMGKKVMQVIDHCTIYLLIAGTYTPILFTAIRRESAVTAWVLFGVEWGFAVLAATLTAIDLKKYDKFSMICYIGMGWGIVFAAKSVIKAVQPQGILLLLLGGISYTVGAVLYGIGKRHRYMHSIFHIFVVVGSILQFFSILFYML
ncbi:MAG: hemolysin III family protein [Clostridia bacterium]|nr:hemolysin III family protein [Clostridia bacterium]